MVSLPGVTFPFSVALLSFTGLAKLVTTTGGVTPGVCVVKVRTAPYVVVLVLA